MIGAPALRAEAVAWEPAWEDVHFSTEDACMSGQNFGCWEAYATVDDMCGASWPTYDATGAWIPPLGAQLETSTSSSSAARDRGQRERRRQRQEQGLFSYGYDATGAWIPPALKQDVEVAFQERLEKLGLKRSSGEPVMRQWDSLDSEFEARANAALAKAKLVKAVQRIAPEKKEQKIPHEDIGDIQNNMSWNFLQEQTALSPSPPDVLEQFCVDHALSGANACVYYHAQRGEFDQEPSAVDTGSNGNEGKEEFGRVWQQKGMEGLIALQKSKQSNVDCKAKGAPITPEKQPRRNRLAELPGDTKADRQSTAQNGGGRPPAFGCTVEPIGSNDAFSNVWRPTSWADIAKRPPGSQALTG